MQAAETKTFHVAFVHDTTPGMEPDDFWFLSEDGELFREVGADPREPQYNRESLAAVFDFTGRKTRPMMITRYFLHLRGAEFYTTEKA